MPDDNSELFEDICNDLKDRQAWEGRQILWSRMRGQGVKRTRKPWPGAADMQRQSALSLTGGRVRAPARSRGSATQSLGTSLRRPAQWKSYGIRIGRDEDATLLAAAPGVLTGFRETGLSEPKAK